MINPVQGFKEASAPKKAAIIAGTAAAAAGIASVAYAAKKGGAGQAIADVFKKAEEGAEKVGVKAKLGNVAHAFGEGYKELGSKIANKASVATTWVKEHLPKIGKQTEEVVEDVVEDLA